MWRAGCCSLCWYLQWREGLPLLVVPPAEVIAGRWEVLSAQLGLMPDT